MKAFLCFLVCATVSVLAGLASLPSAPDKPGLVSVMVGWVMKNRGFGMVLTKVNGLSSFGGFCCTDHTDVFNSGYSVNGIVPS